MTFQCFYLGTHQPHWLANPRCRTVPLFVSHRRLTGRRRLPSAAGRWALDSGGFTELRMFGAWRTTATDYAAAVLRYDHEIGGLDWAAPQDWMCEPDMLARTGLTIADHQQHTVANYLDLRRRWQDLTDAEVPFMPVLQGWSIRDYQTCADRYTDAGVDLASVPVVGVGSVCRRQHTAEIADIFAALTARGLWLHGFGVKTGLHTYAEHLTSADSLAWSYAARRAAALPGCVGHRNCANCLTYALAWRARLLTQTGRPTQLTLDLHRSEVPAA